MSPVQIMRATPAEVPLVAPLFDAYRQFYEQPSDPAGAYAFLTARLTANESVIFLALEEAAATGRTALGFTQLYPSFSSISMRPLWVLNDLFVTPPARKLGVARRLMESAATFARGLGAKSLVLATAEDNRPAQHLYESLGYRQDQCFRHYELLL